MTKISYKDNLKRRKLLVGIIIIFRKYSFGLLFTEIDATKRFKQLVKYNQVVNGNAFTLKTII